MYGTDEHRHALRRIGDATRELETERECLAGLRTDLHDDDATATADARDALREAQQLIGRALAALDKAATSLPTPVARLSAEWGRS